MGAVLHGRDPPSGLACDELLDPLVNGADPGGDQLRAVVDRVDHAPVLGSRCSCGIRRTTRDAAARLRALLALGQLLAVFSEPIGGSSPASHLQRTPIRSPSRPRFFAFRIFTSLLAVFGLLYLGRGFVGTVDSSAGRGAATDHVGLGLAIVYDRAVLGACCRSSRPRPRRCSWCTATRDDAQRVVTLGSAYVATVTVADRSPVRTRAACALAAIGASRSWHFHGLPVLNLMPCSPTRRRSCRRRPALLVRGMAPADRRLVLGMPSSSPAGEGSPTGDRPATTPPGSGAG